MPRACSTCTHPERDEVDQALVNGVSYRNVSKQFRLTVASLHRHKGTHIPEHLAKAEEAKEVAQADSLLDRLMDLSRETSLILKEAREGARKIRARVSTGEDPHADKIKSRQGITVRQLAEKYQAQHAKKANKSWRQPAKLLEW